MGSVILGRAQITLAHLGVSLQPGMSDGLGAIRAPFTGRPADGRCWRCSGSQMSAAHRPSTQSRSPEGRDRAELSLPDNAPQGDLGGRLASGASPTLTAF